MASLPGTHKSCIAGTSKVDRTLLPVSVLPSACLTPHTRFLDFSLHGGGWLLTAPGFICSSFTQPVNLMPGLSDLGPHCRQRKPGLDLPVVLSIQLSKGWGQVVPVRFLGSYPVNQGHRPEKERQVAHKGTKVLQTVLQEGLSQGPAEVRVTLPAYRRGRPSDRGQDEPCLMIPASSLGLA